MNKGHRLEGKFPWLAGIIVLAAAFIPAAPAQRRYGRLESLISRTRFIDVHAHPSSRHVDAAAEDAYPTLEPPIGRPFWPVLKERIAVFDSLEPVALRAIYGYTGTDVTDDDMPGLRVLSRKFWEAGGPAGLDRVLDICGIERVLANSEEPRSDVDPDRVAWVPFIDGLLFPFAAPKTTEVSPRLREIIDGGSGGVAGRLAKSGRSAIHLGAYLDFVDAVLEGWKRRGAVALKLGIAYDRSLRFDDPGWEEAAAAFVEGRQGTLDSWPKYTKVQDVIARRVFLTAGKIGLSVQIHTGFGADARLKMTDSNPLNLESVVADLRFRDTRFLILHAGYPFWKELKPLLEKRNVFAEFSAVNWMVYEDELADILADWLAYPGASEKIMFGSDAGAPVFFWMAAHNSRQALYRALADMIDRGIITEDRAVLVAGKVMRENALRVRNLP